MIILDVTGFIRCVTGMNLTILFLKIVCIKNIADGMTPPAMT
jgi:hypothetical protein